MPKQPPYYDEIARALQQAQARIAALEQVSADNARIQSALHMAEKKYQQLFEHSGDAILIIDLHTDQIIEANSAAGRRFGYTPGELARLTLADLEAPIPGNADPQNADWHSAFGGTHLYETEYRRKDGSRVAVEVSSRVLHLGDRDVLLNVVRDITRRRAIEREREGLIDDLDAFSHTVAHDLKNPLSVVINYATILTDEADTISREELRMMSRAIVQGGQKLSNIVDELLLLAHVRQMEQVPLSLIDMSGIVRSALNRLELLRNEYQAQIVFPPYELPLAIGYGAWVEEIWANYLSNAIKYGGQPPVIAIGAAAESSGMVRYWVTDNGTGIAPESIPELFTQFARFTEKTIDGHGLGLSIVKRIVTRMNGEVGVHSTPGQGSTFSFTLPAALMDTAG
ncbi:MAG: PAS domain-containing sensor histidine kinase [bacterium]|nr:PAS domain-containing sensor histidine kinase [bacterium]